MDWPLVIGHLGDQLKLSSGFMVFLVRKSYMA